MQQPFKHLLHAGFYVFLLIGLVEPVQAQTPDPKIETPTHRISEKIWDLFTKEERVNILARFPSIEVIPATSVGIIQSAQLVDRSTAATSTGSIVGSAVGQVVYLDRAFSGTRSSYSAGSHVGAGLLGALVGSVFDNPGSRAFIINYGVKTMDGQVREQRVLSPDEFAKPLGQCVKFPEMSTFPSSICNDDKVSFLKRISAEAVAPPGAVISREPNGLNIKCRLPGIGMMMLDSNVCLQMDGVLEK